MTCIIISRLSSFAAVVACAAIVSAPAAAKTVRDQRGQTALQPAPILSCGTYKLCAKQGVIVRDHRTGATPPGK